MVEKEVKELLFEITEYFKAEENGSVKPEQLLKANTLILYKDLCICIDDICQIYITHSYFDLWCFSINHCFIANNLKYKTQISLYKNFLLAEDNDSTMMIIKFINSNCITNQSSVVKYNKLFKNIIYENQINTIYRLAMSDFKPDGDLIIPNPIKYIDVWSFFKNKYLYNIKITANLKCIEFAAFAASSVLSIQIDNCLRINASAFQDCLQLETCQLPTNLSILDVKVFKNCKKLNNINLENTQITSISDELFYNCKSLTSIIIPNSVSSIGYAAFYGCTNLSVISFENFDHVVATNIYDYRLPNNLSIIVPSNLFEQWKEVEETETPGSGYYSIDHLVCKYV